jgi:hypothetical protein
VLNSINGPELQQLAQQYLSEENIVEVVVGKQ